MGKLSVVNILALHGFFTTLIKCDKSVFVVPDN